MAQQDFFPSRPDFNPQIYAYSDVNYKGFENPLATLPHLPHVTIAFPIVK